MDKRRKVVTKAHIQGVYTDSRSIEQLRVLVFPLNGRPIHHTVVLISLCRKHMLLNVERDAEGNVLCTE